ncbi:hypothetical protein SAMN04488122_0668 [Chitinophaga arvensicola]|uniref:Uncharacterized protein n=2 Tax=Chitinophaga arvensicola TaxID=29529 RepID=A0A1I0PAK1_9BACT|nr:hypothetical protein SAMN04488122_0668 [Chitinophaga arvensicola]
MPVFAQYSGEDANPAPPAQKKISLAKAAPASADSLSPAVSRITIVNAVWDTARIGFLQTGLFNNKVEAVPDKEMNRYLQDYVDSTFRNLFSVGKPLLVWVVEDLRIGERTQMMSEKSYVRVKVTAFVSKDGNVYKLLKSMDVVRLRNGFDVTHQHRNNISNAFKEFYAQSVSDIDAAIAAQTPELTLDAIRAQYAQKREYPILKAARLNDGVYLNFSSFLENKPEIISFEIKGRAGKSKIYNTTDGQKTLVTAPWGIVKDGQPFKYKKAALIALSRSGYGYVITSYLSAYERRQSAIIGGALIGGIAGGLLGSTAALQHTDAFPELTLPAEATAIDMETGELIF